MTYSRSNVDAVTFLKNVGYELLLLAEALEMDTTVLTIGQQDLKVGTIEATFIGLKAGPTNRLTVTATDREQTSEKFFFFSKVPNAIWIVCWHGIRFPVNLT